MARPRFSIREVRTTRGPAVLISFEIEGGVTSPPEFAAALAAEVGGYVVQPGYGIILDGRGPIWGYGMLVHAARPSSWLALRDPRLGLVVVASQSADTPVGEVLTFPEPERPAMVAQAIRQKGTFSHDFMAYTLSAIDSLAKAFSRMGTRRRSGASPP